MQDLSDRIRRARSLSGHSQVSLADKLGVHRSAVAQWERKDGSKPSMEHLVAIAVATEVSLEWLGTNRGPIAAEFEEPAMDVSEFAQSPEEAEILFAMRKMPCKLRSSLMTMLRQLSTSLKV